MRPGDYVLCVYDKAYHYAAQVLGNYDNERLARAVWQQDEAGRTWQQLYFFTRPQEINIPLSKLERYLFKSYMGFSKISDEGLTKITQEFGSVDQFIEKLFLKASADPVQEEFIDIIKRYYEEGIVFRSATQGARYLIESIDDAGCIIARLDANEPERVIFASYKDKKEILKQNGGKYRFNDFDSTAAKRSTLLQAIPFGLSADKESILDLSNQRKALSALVEIIRNLNVDKSSGKPRLYKPAMLACVVDGLDSGELTENKIEFNWIAPKFIEKMRGLGEEVTEDQAAMAFYHLTNDMIWLLAYKDPKQPLQDGAVKPATVRDRVKHAIIKDTFWRILSEEANRRPILDTIKDRWWPGNSSPQLWWVNQGDTYVKERDRGFVWAPQKGRSGSAAFHWKNVEKIRMGDLIFHYVKGSLRAVGRASSDGYESLKPRDLTEENWTDEGWRADVNYFEMASPVSIDSIATRIAGLKIPYGPINEVGGVNQGYLFAINKEAANIIISNIRLDELPESIRKMLEEIKMSKVPVVDEFSYLKAVEDVHSWIGSKGFIFEPWLIATYITALRTKPFVILAGVSGTGKSKLPALVSAATGGVSKLIPVRPDWTDSSDVLGYCDLQGKFQPGQLMEFVQDAMANPNEHYVCIVDEMNLARVEHYFAEFLSRIEDRSPLPGGGYQSGPLLGK